MRPVSNAGRGPLRDLREVVSLERLDSILRAFGELEGGDRSTVRLRAATGPELDLGLPAHRTAVLAWLRSWGCRHLRVADAARSSRALGAWWRSQGAALPSVRRPLTAVTGRERAGLAAAFAALSAAPAASRSAAHGRVSVSFGETAAAKALFAIRPLACPPWDEPIRVALGLHGAEGYRLYLEQAADALRGLAARLDVPVSRLPDALGRPRSSPPKLVDEYLWMRVNRPG